MPKQQHRPLLPIEENLSAAHLRLASAYIEQLDLATCLDRYGWPHTLFYMDPPYWEPRDAACHSGGVSTS